MALSGIIRICHAALLIGIYTFDIASGLECYTCNSTSTPECAIDPSDKLPVKLCSIGDKECFMAVLDDQLTYRGCASDIEIPTDCDSCETSTCTGNLCNHAIFPEDRLKCYKCSGSSCLTTPEKLRPCLFYDKSDMCYTDVIDETDAIRGCLSDIDYNAGMYSDFCGRDGCNNHTGVSTFTCLACDSARDDNCKFGQVIDFLCFVNVTSVCSVDVLFGRSETCYTYHNGDHVRRGCSRLDSEIVLQSNYVSTCWSENCNNGCINKAMCYVCDSESDERCRDDLTHLITENCRDESSCFTCRNNDTITRGCGDGKSDGECSVCWNGASCNRGSIRPCYQCNSAIDKNCATLEKTPNSTVCNTNCIVKIDEEKNTVRGCQSGSLKCAPNNPLCKECDGANCNGGIFPEDRQRCFQCDGSDPAICNLLADVFNPDPCSMYEPQDKCFQYYDSYGLHRGCTSETRYMSCTDQGSDKCLTCSEPGCNIGLPANIPKDMSCYRCAGIGCDWVQEYSTKCYSYFPYLSTPGCFAYHLANGTTIRGCISDQISCHGSEVGCLICEENGCNNQPFTEQLCIQCNGVLNGSDCSDHPENIKATACPQKDLFYTNRGCYVLKLNEMVYRGCVNRIEEITGRIGCELSNSCEICLEQSCNNGSVPGAATKLGALSILWIVFNGLIFVFYFN